MPPQPAFAIGKLIGDHLAIGKTEVMRREVLTGVKAVRHGAEGRRRDRMPNGLRPHRMPKKAHPARVVVIPCVVGVAEDAANAADKPAVLHRQGEAVAGKAEEVFRHSHHHSLFARHPDHLPRLGYQAAPRGLAHIVDAVARQIDRIGVVRRHRRDDQCRLGNPILDQLSHIVISPRTERGSRPVAMLLDRIDASHHLDPIFKRRQQGLINGAGAIARADQRDLYWII